MSTKTKHTPGPWKYQRERTTSGHPITTIRRADEKSAYNIAIIGDRMPSPAQAEPNARLIAAAPELLEALENAREELRQAWACIEHIKETAHEPERQAAKQILKDISSVGIKCDEAIAKATGGAE